jgi:hypothetical protein
MLDKPVVNVPPPVPGGPPPVESAQADLFDYKLIRDLVGYVLGSVRRQWRLAACTLGATVLLAAVAAAVWPRTYEVSATLLAQRNLTIALLSNPTRSIPYILDEPMRAARESVLRRENLVSLVRQTRLVEEWERTRPLVLRAKDAVMGLVRRPLTEEEKTDAMVATLEKRLLVGVDQGTVSLEVEWPDGPTAYRLVEAAQQNFLETRHVEETSAIAEAITILEDHLQQAQAEVAESLERVQQLQSGRGDGRSVARAGGATGAEAAPAAAAAPRLAPVRTVESAAADSQASTLRSQLEQKQRQLADLEEGRRRRVAELQAALAEQRAIYSDQHPNVADTLQRIQVLTGDSPQIEQLRRDAKTLQGELERASGRVTAAARPASARPPGAAPAQLPRGPEDDEDDPQLFSAQSALRMHMSRYNELKGRIDAARIELDTARAAFKFRFSVQKPAQMPRAPVKPNVAVILLGGVVAGVVLAVFAALAKDLRMSRVSERWQLERMFDLPVLAELKNR